MPRHLLLALLLVAPAAQAQQRLHGLGLGYEFSSVTSKAPSNYVFHSPSIVWSTSPGPDAWLAADVAFLLPLQGRQDGAVYATASWYRRFWGLDALVGRAFRGALRPDLDLECTLGAHLNWLALTAKDGYRDWTSLTGGLGAGGRVRWHLGREPGGYPISVSAFSSTAFDFVDLLRGGDLRWALHLSAGAQVALTFP